MKQTMPTETKHTQGPWKTFWSYGNTDTHRIYKGHSADICETIASVNAFAPTDGDMEQESKANVRLIAAAPELLEALEEVMSGNTNGVNICSVVKARAAIAKAKGSQ